MRQERGQRHCRYLSQPECHAEVELLSLCRTNKTARTPCCPLHPRIRIFGPQQHLPRAWLRTRSIVVSFSSPYRALYNYVPSRDPSHPPASLTPNPLPEGEGNFERPDARVPDGSHQWRFRQFG